MITDAELTDAMLRGLTLAQTAAHFNAPQTYLRIRLAEFYRDNPQHADLSFVAPGDGHSVLIHHLRRTDPSMAIEQLSAAAGVKKATAIRIINRVAVRSPGLLRLADAQHHGISDEQIADGAMRGLTLTDLAAAYGAQIGVVKTRAHALRLKFPTCAQIQAIRVHTLRRQNPHMKAEDIAAQVGYTAAGVRGILGRVTGPSKAAERRRQLQALAKDHDKIIRRYLEHVSARQLAIEYQVSKEDLIGLLRGAAVYKPTPQKAVKHIDTNEVVALKAEGLPVSKIALKLGCTKSNVSYHLKKARSLSPRPS